MDWLLLLLCASPFIAMSGCVFIVMGIPAMYQRVKSFFFGLLHPDQDNHPKVQELQKWLDEKLNLDDVVPIDPDHAGLAIEYAKRQYDESMEAFANLDTKAEKLLTVASTTAAALLAVLKVGLFTGSLFIGFAVTALGFLIVSIATFALVRLPIGRSSPTPIDAVVQATNEIPPDLLRLQLAGSYAVTVAGLDVTLDYKAEKLKFGTLVYVLSLFIFLIGVVCGAVSSSSSSSSQQSSSSDSSGSRSSSLRPFDDLRWLGLSDRDATFGDARRS